MTAEEKLQEVYSEWEQWYTKDRDRWAKLRPEDIDLIANLIIERMKNETTSHS